MVCCLQISFCLFHRTLHVAIYVMGSRSLSRNSLHFSFRFLNKSSWFAYLFILRSWNSSFGYAGYLVLLFIFWKRLRSSLFGRLSKAMSTHLSSANHCCCDSPVLIVIHWLNCGLVTAECLFLSVMICGQVPLLLHALKGDHTEDLCTTPLLWPTLYLKWHCYSLLIEITCYIMLYFHCQHTCLWGLQICSWGFFFLFVAMVCFVFFGLYHVIEMPKLSALISSAAWYL